MNKYIKDSLVAVLLLTSSKGPDFKSEMRMDSDLVEAFLENDEKLFNERCFQHYDYEKDAFDFNHIKISWVPIMTTFFIQHFGEEQEVIPTYELDMLRA